MTAIYVSDKGQVTLPAQIRKKLGIMPKSKMEVEVTENQIVLKPVKSIKDVKGIFRGIAVDKTKDWETIRRETEEAVAREVVNEDIR